jgi:hypothetical protein
MNYQIFKSKPGQKLILHFNTIDKKDQILFNKINKIILETN